MFRKHVKVKLVQLLQSMSLDSGVFPSHCITFINEKSTLCDRLSSLCVKLCIHDAVLFIIFLSNLINYIGFINIMQFFECYFIALVIYCSMRPLSP